MTQANRIPDSDEFISVFGCEYFIDDYVTQKYVFHDSDSGRLILVFGIADNSFGLTFIQNDFQVIKIYDEGLRSVAINEFDQSISISLRTLESEQKIKVTVWPRVQIIIEHLTQ